jgi:hypothetical protein
MLIDLAKKRRALLEDNEELEVRFLAADRPSSLVPIEMVEDQSTTDSQNKQ